MTVGRHAQAKGSIEVMSMDYTASTSLPHSTHTQPVSSLPSPVPLSSWLEFHWTTKGWGSTAWLLIGSSGLMERCIWWDELWQHGIVCVCMWHWLQEGLLIQARYQWLLRSKAIGKQNFSVTVWVLGALPVPVHVLILIYFPCPSTCPMPSLLYFICLFIPYYSCLCVYVSTCVIHDQGHRYEWKWTHWGMSKAQGSSHGAWSAHLAFLLPHQMQKVLPAALHLTSQSIEPLTVLVKLFVHQTN